MKTRYYELVDYPAGAPPGRFRFVPLVGFERFDLGVGDWLPANDRAEFYSHLLETGAAFSIAEADVAEGTPTRPGTRP